jgi:hypothetical protein
LALACSADLIAGAHIRRTIAEMEAGFDLIKLFVPKCFFYKLLSLNVALILDNPKYYFTIVDYIVD